jgi:hypothetical protein
LSVVTAGGLARCTVLLMALVPGVIVGQVIRCDALRTSDSAYAGRCTREGTTIALLVLRPPANPKAGRWSGTQARVFGAGGDTADVVDWRAFGPTFVDVGKPNGIFNWCWCFVTAATVDTDGLHFEARLERPAPPTAEDLAILRLLRSYFPDSTKWNRHDARNRGITFCPRSPTSRTMFCALYDATVAIRGDYYLGQAGNAIQAAIRAETPQHYQHPITEFNNDPRTTFANLKRVVDDAVGHVRDELARPPDLAH